MTKDEDFKLLKIQTCVLKVNIHCDGCRQKVKKLLQRIEGVYQVDLDAEQQKVTVSGSVDSATLIKKLIKAGKHAELWSQKTNQNQNQKQKAKDDNKNNNKGQKQQGLAKGLEAFKNQQHKFPAAFCSEDDDDDYLDDEEFDEDDELQFLREKANQLNLLRQPQQQQQQQAMAANNAIKKGGGLVGGPIASASNNVGNLNVGKQGNPNHQNMGMKANNPVGIDQKTMAAMKMNNVMLPGEASKRANDINAMMGLAGFHGNGANNASASASASASAVAAALGNNSTGGLGLGGGFHQVQQPSNGFPLQGSSGLATGHQHHPSAASMVMNMNNGYHQQYNNYPSSSVMMNLQNRHALQQQQPQPQPQMMYQRSPYIPPSTGYYYNNNYSPVLPYTYYSEPNPSNDHSATHMFSDENTSSCSIM
ncbi:heavy metal-associated isoprenylated plant protein 37-like [Camellia sinensis]|uniref:HMA domain-containing protein n=1 Tax=Camellia sinensis var. sinensis TaxID=542762 RepID=A0A4S4DI30_CAMSN|nr:heavy metal-associated isoprenylated plant protein 37-like [Camellia sinensis]THG02452.1 hypothetical protein TEA_022422 [Camellia sinensis var. sinensis]